MEGSSSIGRNNIRYYYYVCKNRACRSKISAGEIEATVLERVKILARNERIVSQIVKAANAQTYKELPQLETQKAALEKELRKVKNTADNLMSKWASVASDSNTAFLKEKLDKLAARRKDIETGISELEFVLEDLGRHTLNHDKIGKVLQNFSEVFAQMKPYQQKELMSLVLHKVMLGEKGIKIALHGKIPDAGFVLSDASELRTQMLNWLPGQYDR